MNDLLGGDIFIFVYGLVVSGFVTAPLIWAAIQDGRRQEREEDANASVSR